MLSRMMCRSPPSHVEFRGRTIYDTVDYCAKPLALIGRWPIRHPILPKPEPDQETNPLVRLPSCPICRTELAASAATESNDFPFCSSRCREIDLLRWSDGRYAIVEPVSADKLAEKMLDDEIDGFPDGSEGLP